MSALIMNIASDEPQASDASGSASALAPEAVRFAAADSWCFGWYHPPAAPAGDLAVVLCRPFGYEAMCSYDAFTELARLLAASGLAVMRFDYHGTGDSDGDDHEPGRVDAWLDSARAAADEAMARSGASRVAFVGVRLGATLAAVAASRRRDVESLVLWAPCASGRAFTRELRAGGQSLPEGGLRALGYHYGAQTLEQLGALDLAQLAQAPAQRALVIGRDDLPAAGPVPALLKSLHVDTTAGVWPGYSAIMQDPSEEAQPAPALGTIVQWLLASPSAQRAATRRPVPRARQVAALTGAVRESSVVLDGGLFGVLSEPQHPSLERRHATGVILASVGGNHRVGPHRLYVRAARALAASGYRVLRLDLAGIGDSVAPGQARSPLYCKDSSRDVQTAIDALWAQGCRDFVVAGLCSGSYVAFQTAQADSRVGMQILMNSRLLEWRPGHAGDTWQASMRRDAVKSTHFYLQSLREPVLWWRLVRGQVNVRVIARRFMHLVSARLRRALSPLLGGAGRGESLLERMRGVCQRGTETLMLVSDADDGRDYVEFHFGRRGSALRRQDNFSMVIVPEADHTFSDEASQRLVIDTILQRLNERTAAPSIGWPAQSPARAAAD